MNEMLEVRNKNKKLQEKELEHGTKITVVGRRNIMMSKKDYHSLDETSLKVSKHEQEKCLYHHLWSSLSFIHFLLYLFLSSSSQCNFYSPFMSNHNDDDG